MRGSLDQAEKVRPASVPDAAPPPAPRKAVAAQQDTTARQWLYSVLEDGELDTTASKIAGLFLMGLIVANVGAVILETIPSVDAQFHGLFGAFEQFSLIAYTIEYCVRVWASIEDPRISARGALRGRISFALRPMMIIDFLAFAPGYLGFFGIDLRALRIFRLFRLLKLARYSQAIQALVGVLVAERSSLLASVILLLSIMCLNGELMHLAEGKLQPDKLGTLPDAMYWALTTLTTVGYGDVTPITPLGKLIAGFTMVTGLAFFALPIGIIANGFVTGLSRRRFAITWSMLRRYPLFAGFDVNALNEIAESSSATVVREHAHLIVAGKEAREFFMVVSGEAVANYEDRSVDLNQGDVFGEDALSPDTHYHVTVTAHSEMRVLMLADDELRRLVRKYPVLGQRINAMTGDDRSAAALDPVLRLRALEDENARLRQAVSDLTLEKVTLQERLKPRS